MEELERSQEQTQQTVFRNEKKRLANVELTERVVFVPGGAKVDAVETRRREKTFEINEIHETDRVARARAKGFDDAAVRQ